MDDRRHDDDGDHHVDPAVEEAAVGRQHEQCDAVSDADGDDNRDRSSEAEEKRSPEHGPHVENGAVSGAGARGEREGDDHRSDRAERGQCPAGESRPAGQEKRDRRTAG